VPKFKITPHRYIDHDHIADIYYTPVEEVVPIDLGQDPEQIREPKASLSVKLKSGEVLSFEGKDADRVWKHWEENQNPLSSLW